MSNPEEIELGDEEDLGEDDVPDDGDAAELEADEGAVMSASEEERMNGVSAASARQQPGLGGPARASLQASLAALQPIRDNGMHSTLQPASATTLNPEDIELPDD